ncbi:MAG: TrmH family RNA methyltransferase [Spirochaetota bacterium]
MITVRKLASLPAGTRRRKIVRLLEGWERDRTMPERQYLIDVMNLLVADGALPPGVREAARKALETAGSQGGWERPRAVQDDAMVRALSTLRHLLMRHLGIEAGDWDLLGPAGLPGCTAHRPLAGVGIYLESLRSPFNMGSIIRTAAAFGVARVGVSADCPPADHPRVLRSAMGATELLSVEPGGLDAFATSVGGVVIALELGGEEVGSFAFPERGVLVLGSEELGISPSALRRADSRITIPMPGPKASINVGVACGIALAAWQRALRPSA